MKRKIVAVLTAATLAVGMLAGCGGGGSNSSSGSTDTSGTAASEGITTEVGTPRSETLIVESSTPTDTPGQFNSYMTDRKSTRLNSSHTQKSRMPSSA